MKSIFLSLGILLMAVPFSAQVDSTFVTEEDFESRLDAMRLELVNDIDDNYRSALRKSMRIESELRDSMLILNQRLEAIENALSSSNVEWQKTSADLSSTKQSLESVKGDTENKISDLDNSLNSKSLLSYLLIALAAGLALGLFVFLKKRLVKDTSKLDEELTSSRTEWESEHLKLDNKLIDLYESQLLFEKEQGQLTEHAEEEIDHTLALKVADEIVRMQKNISSMPEGTRGLKQLTKAIQRISDTFKVNGYEMIDMIGKPYNEGMKAAATLVPEDGLESGQQIITRIIKPQVNFEGVMIQSAQIEVSVGE